MLHPTDYPVGTKRICVDSDYFRTFNRPNVTLADVRTSPIQEITEHGIRTADAEHAFDSIVFATGFDAMTGALLDIEIDGRDGQRLAEKWADGPRTYLGLMMRGFPNLFTITGPGSPSVLSNMIVAIEQHVEWIAACLRHLRDAGIARIEPERAAEDRWVAHVNEVAHTTLYPRANSLVHGRQHSRQAAGVHAVYRRRGHLSGAVRRDRPRQLPRFPADAGEGGRRAGGRGRGRLTDFVRANRGQDWMTSSTAANCVAAAVSTKPCQIAFWYGRLCHRWNGTPTM